VDKTNSNRDEIWLRSNDVCSQPIDKEVEVEVDKTNSVLVKIPVDKINNIAYNITYALGINDIFY
jgi:hypothetical protein